MLMHILKLPQSLIHKLRNARTLSEDDFLRQIVLYIYLKLNHRQSFETTEQISQGPTQELLWSYILMWKVFDGNKNALLALENLALSEISI